MMNTLFNSLKSWEMLLETQAQLLNRNHGVASTQSGLELAEYETGPQIEAYIEAELINGKAVTWWLELSESEGQIRFEARILLDEPKGQTVLRRFPVIYASSDKLASTRFGMTVADNRLRDFVSDIVHDLPMPSNTNCTGESAQGNPVTLSAYRHTALKDTPIYQQFDIDLPVTPQSKRESLALVACA